ncbi:MAG: MurR/RpiR family transcriptional regulator [Erysipelotrichaceae bacterium]|nr:MurR/RpiR family transcriptional regulator [Erysipelotrichaceae bacterium]
MELVSLVNQNYDKLNENDKIVVKQILIFQKEYANYSCEKMAQECHVSRATLLRICRKIGLNSFSELKYLLNNNQLELKNSDSDFHEVCDDYRLLINDLKKISFNSICELIYNADVIYIYGTGNEQKSLAQELKRIFLSLKKCVVDLFDKGEIEFMVDTFKSNDVFIIISLSGETKEGIEIVKLIRNYIHTISLTRLDNNTISTLCENNLYVSTQKLETLQVTSYEVVGAFYALLDLLYMNYIDYRRCMYENR